VRLPAVQSSQDNIHEGDEGFTVTATQSSGSVTIGNTGLGTILDNDADELPRVRIYRVDRNGK